MGWVVSARAYQGLKCLALFVVDRVDLPVTDLSRGAGEHGANTHPLDAPLNSFQRSRCGQTDVRMHVQTVRNYRR